MTLSPTVLSAPALPFDEAASRASVLDEILENIPHGVCVYDPELRVRMVNRAYREIMQGAPVAIGEHRATIVRRRAIVGEYGPGDPDEMFEREMAHEIDRPQVRRRERPNGTTIDLRTAPLPDGGYIAVVTDVTPLMHAESELRQRMAQIDVMLSSITQGLTLFDKEHRLVIANRMAGELVNLPASMLAAGTRDQDMLLWLHAHGEFGAGSEAEARFAARRATDRTRTDTFRRRTSDGRVLEFRSDPTPDEGYVATLTDVTQAMRTEAELRRAKALAEAANQAKSRFLATMSHELRTPLNAVIGFSEALARQSETASPAEIAECAGTINEAGRHLLGLINTILDVARIEAGRFEMSADPIELGRFLDAAMRAAAPVFGASEITLTLDPPQALPTLYADERRLQQVLASLLSNAAKFTEAGGLVTVSAGRGPRGELSLKIADSGIGIAPADLERVFEPFVQLDGTLARRFPGAGLGLYLARSLVEAHGGKLRLRSAPGAGTTAEIVLPAWRLEAANPSVDKDFT